MINFDHEILELFSISDEFQLSNDFLSHHFLVGALLVEVRAALGEVAEIQRIAIGVLRDLIAKHAFDDRYLQNVRKVDFIDS